MQFYHCRQLTNNFEDVEASVREALQREGFGVITSIDMSAKLNEKLGVSLRKYTILGACNPPLAYKALQVEDKIGVMLPCNVILQEKNDGRIEVAAIDPVQSMAAVGKTELAAVAEEVSKKLKRVVESI